MSVLKFNLTQKHIDLVKHLQWNNTEVNNKVISTTTDGSPFGGFDHYEDMGVILYGRPDDFNPLDGNPFEWSDEQKNEIDKLLSELPMALDVILYTQSFVPGEYKTKFHNRDWKKIK